MIGLLVAGVTLAVERRPLDGDRDLLGRGDRQATRDRRGRDDRGLLAAGGARAPSADRSHPRSPCAAPCSWWSACSPASVSAGSPAASSRHPRRCGSRSRPRTAFGVALAHALHARRRRRRRQRSSRTGAFRSRPGWSRWSPSVSACASATTGSSDTWRALLLLAAIGGPIAWPWYLLWGVGAARGRSGAPAFVVARRRADRRCLLRDAGWAGGDPAATGAARARAVPGRRRPRAGAGAAAARLTPAGATGVSGCPASPRLGDEPGRRSRPPARPALHRRSRASSRRCWRPMSSRRRSLWLDEAASVAIASQHGGALWHAIAHDGGNMLAYYLLLHALIGLFGTAPAAIRLVSVIATAATVGARVADRPATVRPERRVQRRDAHGGEPAADLLGAERPRLCTDGHLRRRFVPRIRLDPPR